jgi:mitogen-activated protein kinase kinase kinase 7
VLHFSDLELGECISHGEFAVVHRGALRVLPGPPPLQKPKEVVVKMLHQKEDCMCEESAAAAAVELLSEISMIAQLSHPRLVSFVGACLDPLQGIALVTELAPGGNLHHALHVRRRQLVRRERFQLALELLEGVRYLHARQPVIAHLDLKSMNLVLDAEGQHLQICDFGLARAMGPGPGPPDGEEDRLPNRNGGSPRYMAPECYDSKIGPLTEKADVWSSGCILIEIFGACLPYASCSNVQQILKNMLVHHSGPAIPDSVEASVRNVITCTLAFEARERQAIAQVLLQLQTVASSTENKSRFLWIP